MKKIIIIFFLLLSFLNAENFSEMSTQELIAIMGFVTNDKINDFNLELNNRVTTMNEKEKKEYLKNLKKKKNE